MPFSNDNNNSYAYNIDNNNITKVRKTGVSGQRTYKIDDLLDDELPDYSSRRSSFNSGFDQKPNQESERSRKISTASNTLEVPRHSHYNRQNSVASTASLVSNSSVLTFSYQNFRREKFRHTFGGTIILIGLVLLVIGICLLVFGNSHSSYLPIVSINQTTSSANNEIKNDNHISSAATIGYFALFLGILILLIGVSVIFCIQSEEKVIPPKDLKLERRVSTIDLEPIPNVAETSLSKPEIMITTDSLRDQNDYRKFPTPNSLITKPKISFDE